MKTMASSVIFFMVLMLSDVRSLSLLSGNFSAETFQAISEASTTEVRAALREIVNQESLVRFAMVQKIQELMLTVVENKIENEFLKKSIAGLKNEVNDLKKTNRELQAKNEAFQQKFERELSSLSQSVNSITKVQAEAAEGFRNISSSLSTVEKAGGVYVRWGRRDCPTSNIELVYTGYAGGSWYEHSGAAAEFVCLPPDPDLTTKFSSSAAKMYGAEYDSNDFASHGIGNGDDLPCAVCRNTVESSVLMIPGKSNCYDGWSMQYRGDLVAGSYSHTAATQYICLDENPEALPGGRHNHNGKLFHPVVAVCGALTCPPYHDNKYLTCVVCTK